MQLHHTSTVTPGARPVRFNRRGNPPFAAVPIDDNTSVLVESAAEARSMVAAFAQAAEFLESLERPALAEMIVRGEPKVSPECAVCHSTELTIFRGGQWTCWNTEHCAERAEQRHLSAVTP